MEVKHTTETPFLAETNPETEKDSFSGKGKNVNPVKRRIIAITDEQYLQERLDGQLAWYDRKSSENKNKFRYYKRLEFIIAAFIPVLVSFSAVPSADGSFMKYVTIFCQVSAALGGVFLVIINKILDLEEYYKNWKEYRVTAEALRQERFLYLTCTDPYDEEDCFPILVSKTEAILNNETQKWKQTSNTKKEEKPKEETAVVKDEKEKPTV